MLSVQSSSPSFRGLRILIIEDEVHIASYLRGLLTDLGYECLGPFGKLGEALHHAQTDDIDAAILNFVIPGRNAYSVAEILARRDIPFGFASGVPHPAFDAKWVGRPYLDKPFSAAGIGQFVRTILQAAAPALWPCGIARDPGY